MFISDEVQSRASKFRKESSFSMHSTPSSKKPKIHGASCDWLFSVSKIVLKTFKTCRID